MSGDADRLAKCFATVFPELPPARIFQASQAQLEDWDSLRHITLLTIVGEEFETEMPLDDFEQMASFAGILAYLESGGR